MNQTFERVVDTLLDVIDRPDAQERVAALLTEAVTDPAVVAALDTRVGLKGLEAMAVHRSDKLTVLAAVVPPGFAAAPHNHNLWSVVAVARGREDNEFYERRGGGLERTGEYQVVAPGVLCNAADAIHSIANNLDEPLAVLHAYGGDLFGVARSNWDPQTGEEVPFDWANVSSEESAAT